MDDDLTMRPDDDNHNADWPKRTADFPGWTVEDFVNFIRNSNLTAGRFLALPGAKHLPESMRQASRDAMP